MISLESCVSQHIKNLVSSLTNKKQFKGVSTELNKLVSTFGIAAEKHMFSVLLQDIEFKDPRTISGSKDQFKIMYLQGAIQAYSAKPAFLDYFSQIFPSGDIEEFFDLFAKILNLQPVTQLIIAVSLSLSSTPHVARAGLSILKSKLGSYLSIQKPQKIPPYAFHCILYLIKNSSEFADPQCKDWTNLLSNSLQAEEKSKILPFLNEGKENFNLVENKNHLISEMKSSLTLAEILEDMGPYCSQSLVTLREILSNFPEIREAEMAEVLSVLCEKCSDVVDYESRVISATFSSVKQEDWFALGRDISDKRIQATWGLDIFCKAVRETYALHWDQVIENLDIPRFVIRNEQAFSLLVNFYYKITGKKFPIAPLFKIWKNPRGQVSLLLQAIYSNLSYEMFNFSDSPNKAPTDEIEMQSELKVIIQALSSLDLLKILFELSATEFYISIRNVFINEIKRFPDILIIGLSMVKPTRGQGLLHELINMVMPQFMCPQTSSQIVLQIIWTHNPDLIIHGAVEYYEREPTSMTLTQLLDLTQEIRDSLLKLVSCENHLFTVHFGLLAIKRDFLHLEHWIKERIANGKEPFVKTLLDYLQKNLLDIIKENPDNRIVDGIFDKAQITKESLAVIFEKLSETTFSSDTQKRIHDMYKEMLTNIPSLYPASSQEEIDEAANKYYQQLYSNEMLIPEFINLVKRLKSSALKNENDIFDCMINNLFDEFRFFSKYPEKELKITGELFGALINQNLLVGVHLFLALKHIEIALRTPKNKLFRFGWFALCQFKGRLIEWPNFCNELVLSEGLKEDKPEFIEWLKVNCNLKKPEDSKEITKEPSPDWEKKSDDESKFMISDQTRDRIMFIMNTTDSQNVIEKSEELKKLMMENEQLNIPWFANYLVVKRVSQEINFHDLYLRMIKSIGMKSIYTAITNETYSAIHKLLALQRNLDDNGRKILNSLGQWIGTLTIARNKPILIRCIDLKDEIIKSYEKENINAVIPFICNILKSSANSEVFSNANPWMIALVSLLHELKQKEGVKLRISHEIENLFKTIRVSPETFPQTSLLNIKEMKPFESAKEFIPAAAEVVALTTEHRSMASLPEYVQISPKLLEHYPEQELKKIISISIEQVIKEIIQPIVQRNVNIALITTKELVLKDFSLEKDPSKLQEASRWVVQSLAGSLARVTSREPFRVHLVNSLNEVFKNKNLSPEVCKQIVEIASIDNLELGCGLIAKIVVEKALNDVNHEESIKEAYNKRLEKFSDDGNKNLMWHGMPDMLKPKSTGLTKEQFEVYRNFVTMMDNPKKSSALPTQEIRTQDKATAKFDEQVEAAEAVFASRNEAEDPEVQQAILSVIKIAFSNKSEYLVACASKIFKRMYTNELLISFYIQILQSMKMQQPALIKDITEWVIKIEDHKRFYWHVTGEIIKADIVILTEIDKVLARSVDSDYQLAISFAVSLVKEYIIKTPIFQPSQFPVTVSALKNLREKHPKNEEVSKLLQDLPELKTASVFCSENDKQRELIVQKFEEWLSQGETYVNTEKAPCFVNTLETLGLTSKEKMETLFGVMIEHAIERTGYADEGNYGVIDSFAKLFQVILLMAQPPNKIKPLLSLLMAIKNLILKAACGYFNPRPYFRLFMLVLTDITQPSPTYTDQVLVQEMLVPIATTLHLLNPMRVPGFCFAWLDLISHRFFMPKMIRTVNPSSERSQVPVQWTKMSTLIVDLLKFVYYNYSNFPLSESLRAFYHGTVKVICVLLHDFPEFLCDYHYDFCNYIPEHCLQLRNLILSPFPKSMRLPSPFTPNLKVDLLPEMKIAPNILSNFKCKLGGIKEDIDTYFLTRDISMIQEICCKLKTVEMRANATASNSLVLYVAEMAVNGQIDQRFFNEFFLAILLGLDNEARKHFINAVANQLRYPNTHTQYFSCAMLHMFSECKKPFIEEQIARVLTERTSVYRPHPWGLLITMIELVKNPRYDFLKKPFTHCTQDIENFYEKVSKEFYGGSDGYSLQLMNF